MRARGMISVLILCSVFALSGCVVRVYQVTKGRADQDLSEGNRGYLTGQPPKDDTAKERKMTRETQVVEIELHSPIKFEKVKKARPVDAGKEKTGVETDRAIEGNRGYITSRAALGPGPGDYQQYTVSKGDTLQTISQKFYGTTKKWAKIYNANKDVLKGPNKIYPGQVLHIPVEAMKEPKENLK